MTDRLASCRESPTGKHEREAAVIDGLSRCRYCGRQGKVSLLVDNIGWNVPDDDPDDHIGHVGED